MQWNANTFSYNIAGMKFWLMSSNSQRIQSLKNSHGMFFFENPRNIFSHEILIHTYPSWLIDSIFGAWCISTCLDGLQRRVAFPETCLHCYLICVGDGICRCREFGSISSICQYSDRECNLVGTSCCRSPIQQTHLLLGWNLLRSCHRLAALVLSLLVWLQ